MAGLSRVTFLIWAFSSALVQAGESNSKCSYSVETIQFGLLMKMTDFTAGSYTIDVADEEGPFERRSTVSFSSENSTHEIKPLKPCTKYQLNVTLIDINGREIFCSSAEIKTTTGMSEQDIKKVSCPSGYFCYQSGWNISSLPSKHNKVSAAEFKNGSYRFKPAYEDICSDFVLEFPGKNCLNVFSTTPEYVPVDFIDPNDIKQTKPTELPAKIEATLPSNCKDLSVEYKCSVQGYSENMGSPGLTMRLMKPFTDYSCTGDIKNNDVSINKTTPPVQFNINCDFTIINLNTISTDTSIEMSWNIETKKCQAVLHKLEELTYSCSCQAKKGGNYATAEGRMTNHPDGGRCEVRDLKPYKDYSCEVRPIYGDQHYFKGETVTERTKLGYNEKVRISCLIVLIIIIIIIIIISCVVLRVAFFLSVSNEELMLNSTAFYINMPPSNGNHKAR